MKYDDFKKVMNGNIIEALVCPLCKDSKFSCDKGCECFICNKCHRKYDSINLNGTWIPNFLIDDNNWEKGPRGIRSGFLKKNQGKPFKRQIDDEKLILDIGCGENARGNINIDCYIPSKIPQNFILANAAYLPFRKNSVDIILSSYSMEHLINPAIFIQDIYKIAKEKVEIITDNSEWLGDVFFRLLGDGRVFHNEHYYKWSVEYLNNLISRLGYEKNKVYLLNLSTNSLVKGLSVFGKIPRIGNLFYRDLKIEIWK